MPNLEEVIRDLVARGELNHLSVGPSQKDGQSWSEARKDPPMWRASFTMCSKFGISFAEDPDPVKAIILACTTAKMRPRAPVQKPIMSLDLVAESSVTSGPPAEAEDPAADLM